MESTDQDSAATVARSQNVVYTLPPDRGHIPMFMVPFVTRIDRAIIEPQVIVVTPDAELALDIVSVSNDSSDPVSVLPVTSVKRAARLLQARPAQLIAGDAPALLELIRSASLKLDAVRGIVVAWADHILEAEQGEALDAIFSELPREIPPARAVVVERMNPQVESLLERYLRRARRVEPAVGAEGDTGTVSALVTSVEARKRAVRRLFDELDPARALVVAATDDVFLEAESAVSGLGLDDISVKVAHESDVDAGRDLVVIYGLPRSREMLARIAAASPGQVVAIIEARQLPALRRLASSVAPFVFPDPTRTARSREDKLRQELRRELANGAPTREMLALEPLLSEFEALELAAASLRLLERERSRSASKSEPVSAPAGTPAEGGFVKVFLTVGARDGVTPGDIVGSITGESGIRSNRLGKIDIRDTFSLVEVAAPDADKVINSMAGTTLRGRRLAARLDQDSAGAGAGAGRDRGASPRGGGRPRSDSSDRGKRSGRGGPPPRDRDFKPRGRDGAPPRRDTKPFARGRDESPGAPRRDREGLPPDRDQWTSRGDAMRNAKRPRGDRPKPPADGDRDE